jgi:hypothetical protein
MFQLKQLKYISYIGAITNTWIVFYSYFYTGNYNLLDEDVLPFAFLRCASEK